MKCFLMLLLMVVGCSAASNVINSSSSLQSALTNSVAGDTNWIRGGTYFPVQRLSSLNGTNANSPTNGFGWAITCLGQVNNKIVFRSYPGEWAKIDRPIRFSSAGNIVFQDLEFYDSLKGFNPGNVGFPYPTPWIHFDANGGEANEFISCVIHDVNDCFGGNSAARGVSGCVFWYVGSYYYEHEVYPSCSNYVGNVSGWTSGSTIQIGTHNDIVKSNIVWGANTMGYSPGNEQAEFLITDGATFTDNCDYEYPSGQATILNNNGGVSSVLRNKLVGFVPASFNGAFDANISNNTFYMQGYSSAFYVLSRLSSSAGTWTANSNSYFSIGAVHFNNINTSRTFAQWKSDYGIDANSTATDSAAPPDSVTVIPHPVVSKRANISIYNWSLANNVNADLSSVLSAGDSYQIYSAQNYGAGAIKSGIFGGTTISVPMTNLTTAPILYSFGTNLVQPSPTSPEFGAFIVIGQSAGVTTMNVGTGYFNFR